MSAHSTLMIDRETANAAVAALVRHGRDIVGEIECRADYLNNAANRFSEI